MSANLAKDAAREASIRGFLHRQYFVHPKPLDPSIKLTDQVAIITGSNAGLGFETARQLCQLGLSRLVMGVRSQSKGDEAAEKLRKEFPKMTVDVWIIDMSSYDSVIAFTRRCESLPRIDMTILNAGIQMRSFEKNPTTNHEVDLQVNYLSTALLTILLVPILRSKKAVGGPVPVLCPVSSDTAHWATLKSKSGPVIAQLDDPADFGTFANYSKSKLLLIMFIASLAAKVNSNELIINTVNPGMTGGTGLGTQSASRIAVAIVHTLQKLIARSMASGASTYVDAVLAEGPASHGSYVSDWTIKPYPAIMYTTEGEEAKETLWKETMAELDFAGVSNILGSVVTTARLSV